MPPAQLCAQGHQSSVDSYSQLSWQLQMPSLSGCPHDQDGHWVPWGVGVTHSPPLMAAREADEVCACRLLPLVLMHCHGLRLTLHRCELNKSTPQRGGTTFWHQLHSLICQNSSWMLKYMLRHEPCLLESPLLKSALQ